MGEVDNAVQRLLAERRSHGTRRFAVGIVIIAIAGWAAVGTEVNPAKLVEGVPKMGDLLSRMLPPDAGMLRRIADPLLQTLEMALLGTTMGMLLALPFSFLAATNTSPSRIVGTIARTVIATLRTVPELIWAMLLVTAVGLGPFPGVIALTLHTLGGLGKLYYESIESIAPGPLDAMRAVGASRIRVNLFGIVPAAMPLLLSNTLFYWEYNNRASTVLGLVGAGGIGFALTQSVANFAYREATTCLLAIVVVLACIDRLSAALRQRIT